MIKIVSLLILTGLISTSILGQSNYINGEKDIIIPLKKYADSILQKSNIYVSPSQALKDLELSNQKKESIILSYSNSKKKLAPNVIYHNYISSIALLVMCSKKNPLHPVELNYATSFLISENGICITNCHVISAFAHSSSYNDKGVMMVRFNNGKVFQIEKILGVSAKDDIAVFRLANYVNEDVKPLQLALSDPDIGADVFILGNPFKQLYSITSGIIADKYNETLQAPDGQYYDRNLLSITADFSVGASGSPLINQYGQIIGMVSSTYVVEQNNMGHPQSQLVIKNAIPISSIRHFIQNISQ